MLDSIDLSVRLSRDEYKARLRPAQVKLRALAFDLYRRRRPVVIVYEGWDAAGKGGNIRRLTGRLDPRGYEVHSIAAPEGEDAQRHYLWRFWRRLPRPDEKQVIVFDRSWYGRVLVERVEGFAEPDDWRRAYREINDFERQLADAGTILVKFWLHISKQEQLERFRARDHTPHKTWKLTDEDWRNRDKWDLYEQAVEQMLELTSTEVAPWTVVESNDKYFARVKSVETVTEAIQSGLGIGSSSSNRNP